MIDQKNEQRRTDMPRRRRAGILVLVAGIVATLASFGYFPGLPHVIDWGAILIALAVGVVARWGCLSWMDRRDRR
ncbi:MAG: hypothetical protein QOI83_1109 [Streptomycetaceae bacterium]|nr:hypothetical protein [Streptomycetaceae bacterium]